jgi:hypothetical protein
LRHQHQKGRKMAPLRSVKVKLLILAMVCIFVFFAGTVKGLTDEKGIAILDHFSKEGPDEKGIPAGWQAKSPGSASKIDFAAENDPPFLHIVCINDNIAVGKKVSFEIRKYPFLSWTWKATRLPEGGDIRKRATDEQVGQVYVVFPKFPAPVNTRSVGYIWDTQAPAGFSGTSTVYSKMKYIVLQSGPEKLNQWVQETRNVYEDYQRLFHEDPPTVGGIVLYINTQHSKSAAEVFYADISFSSTLSGSNEKYTMRTPPSPMHKEN